jgi:arylsulfatase A-like enzyme
MQNRVKPVGSVHRWLLLTAAVLGLLIPLAGFWFDLPARFSSLTRGGKRVDLNVLVITLDTTRADAIGTYGGRAVTPTLDHLADTGIVFEQASTVAPLTLPAHTSLFTALFPPRHHVHGNGQPLAASFVTLAERMAAGGFHTGAFVSSFVLDRTWGLNQGFDVYRGSEVSSQIIDRQALRRPADRVVDDALSWLQRIGGRRFFGWLHFYDAHAPAQAPAEFTAPNGQPPYLGAIGFIDLQLSRVITFLAERGLLDRTVIVVVGDHGESLGDHGEPTHGLFVYESVIRVPLIIRAPFETMRGRRVADPVRIVDVVPTVLDLVGETVPSDTDGQTLSPLMNGAVKELGLEAYSESRYGFDRFGWSPLTALRRGSLKLIVAPRPELYDLASDPHESTNLYSQRAAAATAMSKRLHQIGQPGGAQQPAQVPVIDPAALGRLAALGYVSAPSSNSPVDAATPLVDPKDRIDLYRQFTAQRRPLGGLP